MIASLEVYRGQGPPDWDDTVAALGGTVFHSSHWASYQATQGALPIFVRGTHEGAPAVAAVGLLRRSSKPIVSLLMRSLTFSSHPCARSRDTTLLETFVHRCEALARSLRCSSVALDSWMSGESQLVPSRLGYTESLRFEFLLDLTSDTDTLWRGMRKDQRERVRHLEKTGVLVTEGATREDLSALRIVREVTQAKRTRQGLGYELGADEAFYDRVHQHLVRPGVGRLFVASHEGNAVAAIFFAVFNKRAYSVFSGSTQEGYRLGAQTLLFWRALERFKAEGLMQLNRGGLPASAREESDPLHGIYRFKTRLGTTPVLCRSGQKVLNPLLAALASLERRARRGGACV